MPLVIHPTLHMTKLQYCAKSPHYASIFCYWGFDTVMNYPPQCQTYRTISDVPAMPLQTEIARVPYPRHLLAKSDGRVHKIGFPDACRKGPLSSAQVPQHACHVSRHIDKCSTRDLPCINRVRDRTQPPELAILTSFYQW